MQDPSACIISKECSSESRGWAEARSESDDVMGGQDEEWEEEEDEVDGDDGVDEAEDGVWLIVAEVEVGVKYDEEDEDEVRGDEVEQVEVGVNSLGYALMNCLK